MKAEQAKLIPLVQLLAYLGYSPKAIKKSGIEYWFHSPFRDENTASFKVKSDDNIWYDFGEGKGGNILDFVMLMKHTDFKGALYFLETTNLSKALATVSINSVCRQKKTIPKQEDKRKIVDIKPVFNYALKSYIVERAIKNEIANKYLKELHYEFEGKAYYALAFSNRSGGWELRSSTYKSVIGVKDITVIENNFDRVNIFEGFMDFLSYLTLKGDDNLNSDFIILNSVNMALYGIEFIKVKNYKEVNTFLNNDNAGKKASELFKEEFPNCISGNYLYSDYNDLNELLINRREKVSVKPNENKN